MLLVPYSSPHPLGPLVDAPPQDRFTALMGTHWPPEGLNIRNISKLSEATDFIKGDESNNRFWIQTYSGSFTLFKNSCQAHLRIRRSLLCFVNDFWRAFLVNCKGGIGWVISPRFSHPARRQLGACTQSQPSPSNP